MEKKTLSKDDVLLRVVSTTCKSYKTKFDSFADMQHHMLIEHMQKGDYQFH
jgi:hypothetical protein